jgi:Kef-type K+ transport system membrane component KefB
LNPTVFSSIEFQMSLLLFVALAGYLIAYRINQSAVIGIILAGIVVGPSVLGLITNTVFVSSLAQLGAIALLFTIGLHFSIKEITNVKYFVIALVGVIVPWISGFFLSMAFGFEFGGSVFIGTALTATSIAITATVLKEMGKLATLPAKAIIGAAIMDDVLGLLALSFTEGIVLGEISLLPVLFLVLKAVAFLAIGTIVGNLGLVKLMHRMSETKFAEKYPETLFVFAIMVAFLYALVASLMGLSAIIGSFLAGVVMGQVELEKSRVFRQGADYLQIIFASIFFISLGILLDFRTFSWSLGLFVLLLIVVAVLSKLAGCGITAKLLGNNFKDSMVIGFGMAPRGEVAMIVALIGLNQKLINQDVYSALVLMSLVTTIVTPLILRNWFYHKKHSKKPMEQVENVQRT